jgi:GTP cyclohydrolase I
LDQSKVQKIVTDLLLEMGENPKREGLISTPKRVAKSYEFLTSGYNMDIKKVMNEAMFEEKYDEMVL